VEVLRLLFDIVNVQNWPAAPRSARSGSPCSKVAFDCGSAPLTIFQFSVRGA
jgi:hypothetical protein